MDSETQKVGVQELIRHMLAWSGTSAADVSRAMGKTSGYLSVMLYNESTPRLDLFIRIAEACGYTLELHENQDYESWELGADNGEVFAMKEFGPEDIGEISQMQEDAREAMKSLGKQELIDSLIDYLQSLKEQPASD